MTALVGVGVLVNATPSSVNKLEQELETEMNLYIFVWPELDSEFKWLFSICQMVF